MQASSAHDDQDFTDAASDGRAGDWLWFELLPLWQVI